MKDDVKSDRWKEKSLIVVNERNRLFASPFLVLSVVLPKRKELQFESFGGLCCLRDVFHPDCVVQNKLWTGKNQQKNLNNMTCFLQIPKSEIHSIRIHMQNPFLLIDRMLM